VPDIVDTTGRTPLSYALENKRLDIAMLIRQAGGQEVLDMPDVDGMTLTRWAVEPLIRLKDEELGLDDKMALQSSVLDCVKWVIRSQGQVDPVDRNGESPLMVAAAVGDINTAKYLVRMSADVKRKSKAGSTAMDFAKDKKTDLMSVKKRVVTQLLETDYDLPKTLWMNRASQKHDHTADIVHFFETALDKKKKMSWFRKHEKKLVKAIEQHDVESVTNLLKKQFTCKLPDEKVNMLAKAELSLTNVPPNEEPLVALAVVKHTKDAKTKEIIDLLVACNAGLDAMDAFGSCALGAALELGHHDLVHHLLEKEANPFVMDDYGRSPFLVGMTVGFAVHEVDARTELAEKFVKAMDESIYKTMQVYERTKGARVFGAWKRKNVAHVIQRKEKLEKESKGKSATESLDDAMKALQSEKPHGGFWGFMSPFAYDFAGWGPFHWACYSGEKKLLDWLLDMVVHGKCGGEDDETNPAVRVESGPPFFAAALSSAFATLHWVEMKIHLNTNGLAAICGVQNFRDLLSVADAQGCKFRDYLLRTIPEVPQLDDIDDEEKDLHATCVAWYRRHVEDVEKRKTQVDGQILGLATGAKDTTNGWDAHVRRGAKSNHQLINENETVVARSEKLAKKWHVDELHAELRDGRKRATNTRATGGRKTLTLHPGLRVSRKIVLKELPKPKNDFADKMLIKQFKTFITEEHTLQRRQDEAKRRAEAQYNLGRRWVVDDEGPEEIDMFDL
jgi:ankyrin repeat protein